MKLLVAIAFIIALFIPSQATHFRYATVKSNQQQQTTGTPLSWEVTVNVEGAYRADYPNWAVNGGPALVGQVITLDNVWDWNDGNTEQIHLTVTTVNVLDDWLFGIWQQNHNYPAPTTFPYIQIYQPFHTACCRIITLINNGNNDPWNYGLRIVVAADANGNSLPTNAAWGASPVVSMLPIVAAPINTKYAMWTVPASYSNGPCYFRLSVPSEMGSTVETQPLGGTPLNAAFSINLNSGQVLFDTTAPPAQFGLYCTQHIVATANYDYTQAVPYLDTPTFSAPSYLLPPLWTTIDYLINVTAQSLGSPCVANTYNAGQANQATSDPVPSLLTPNGPTPPANAPAIQAEPNKPLPPIYLIGYDSAAPTDPTRAVAVFVGGLPTGSNTTTVSGALASYVGPASRYAALGIPSSIYPYGNGNPFTFMGPYAETLIFNWTPLTTDIGTHIICFSVIDAYGGSVLCDGYGSQYCFTIVVQVNPCFNGGTLVALNPANYTLAQCQASFTPVSCSCNCPNPNYAPPTCSACANASFYGPTCQPCPPCVTGQGACAGSISGNGQCICSVGWTGPSCNSSNSFQCNPTTDPFIRTGTEVNSTNSLVNPISADIQMETPNAPYNTFTYPLGVYASPTNVRNPDIILLQDLSGQGGSSATGTTPGTLLNLVDDGQSFLGAMNQISNVPEMGFAIFNGNALGSYQYIGPLTLDPSAFAGYVQAVAATGLSSADSADVPLSAIEAAAIDPSYNYRSNAPRFIVCFMNAPFGSAVTAARIATFKTNMINANTIPIFLSVQSGTISSMQTVVNGVGFGQVGSAMQPAEADWTTQVPTLIQNAMQTIVYAVSDPEGWVSAIPPNPACSSPPSCSSATTGSNLVANYVITYPGNQPAGGTTTLVVIGIGSSVLNIDLNQPPVAVSSTVSGTEDQPVPYTLGAYDPDNNILFVEFMSLPANGVLQHYTGSGVNITTPGQISGPVPQGSGLNVLSGVFYPGLHWCGNTSFTYLVNDGCLNSSIATVSLSIQCINYPPTCQAITCADFTGNENQNLTVNFTPYIADVDDPLNTETITITAVPTANATMIDPANTGALLASGASLAANGQSVIVDPKQYFYGPVSFTYTVTDRHGASSSPCTSTICFNHVNQCPTISILPSTMYVKFDTPGVIYTATVTITDPDNPDAYNVTIVNATVPFQYAGASTLLLGAEGGYNFTSTGQIVQSGSAGGSSTTFNLEYEPTTTASGPQGEITLQAFDLAGASCGPATFDIIVSNNTPPYIIDYHNYQTPENQCLNETITCTGTDPDGVNQATDLGLFFNTLPTNGQIFEADGTPITPGTFFPYSATTNIFEGNATQYFIIYCPDLYFFGTDCWTYTVQDPLGANSLPRTDCINVTHVNQPPYSNNVTITITENTCGNLVIPGYDPDTGDVPLLTLTIESNPAVDYSASNTTVGSVIDTEANSSVVNGAVFTKDSSGAYTINYCPPQFAHSKPAGQCYMTFTYLITDPSLATSPTYTACVIITYVPSPPSCSGPTLLTGYENTPLEITLSASTPDVESQGLLYGVIVNIPTATGYLRLTNDTTQPTLVPGSTTTTNLDVWFFPDAYQCTLPPAQAPLYTFYYQVEDPNSLLSATCEVDIIVQCVNQPPTCPAFNCFTAIEDSKSTFVVPFIDDWFNDPTHTGVTLSFLDLNGAAFPSDGTIFTRTCDNGCYDTVINNTAFTSGTYGPISGNSFIFLAEPNQNTDNVCNYTTICVRITDILGAFTDCCFNVSVQPINHPPVITPYYPTTSGVGTGIICENSFESFHFNVTDVDQSPSQLTAFITLPPSGLAAGSALYWCDNPDFDNQTAQETCINAAHLVSAADNFQINWVIPGVYDLIFVPPANDNAGDNIFATIAITAYDNYTGPSNASIPATIQIKVKPVNHPPVITSPAQITTIPETTVVITPCNISDPDINSIEASTWILTLTIEVVEGRGILDFASEVRAIAFRSDSTIPSEPTPCYFDYNVNQSLSPYKIICNDVLNLLVVYANHTTYKPLGAGELFNSNITCDVPAPVSPGTPVSKTPQAPLPVECTADIIFRHAVNFTISDDGYYGGESCADLDTSITLNDTSQTIINVVVVAIVAIHNSNVLTGVIAGVAAAMLLLLAAIIKLVRDRMNQVPDSYFDAFGEPNSDVAVNPLFQESGNSGSSQIYQGEDSAL